VRKNFGIFLRLMNPSPLLQPDLVISWEKTWSFRTLLADSVPDGWFEPDADESANAGVAEGSAGPPGVESAEVETGGGWDMAEA
jgi:hypothetical protein